MAAFICFEADASDGSNDEEAETVIDDNLIDDSDQENNEPSFFRFHNQTRDYNEIVEDIEQRAAASVEHLEANNYLDQCEIDDIGNESLDESDAFERRKTIFLSSLKSPAENQTRENSFYLTLLHAIRFLKNKKMISVMKLRLKKKLDQIFISKLQKKNNCILDLNKTHFDDMCYEINEILIEKKLFLRVYEIKDKFRYLFHEDHSKKNVLRSLSSCIKENLTALLSLMFGLQKKKKVI